MRDVVCMCVDARMLVPAFFVADSIKKASAAVGREYDIVVLVPGGETTAEERSYAAANGIAIDDSLDVAPLAGIPILQERLSQATLFKLLLASHFRGRYRRILYLDADLTIHGDPGALFRLDVGDYALAAVPAGRMWLNSPNALREQAYAHFTALGMTSPFRYFNAGVLLIHPDNWVKDEIDKRALAFLKRNPELCPLPGEDSLNAVFDGRFIEISPVWNLRIEQERSGRVQPVIIHYAGVEKPWRRFSRLREFRPAYRLYAEFIRHTPWPNWLRAQWTFADLAGSVRREVEAKIDRLIHPPPLRDPARRAAFEEEVRNFYRTTRFADLEQGITIEHDGRIQLA